MDTATVTALLEITETSRAALRREEPGAEAPVEARYADILEALQWLLDRADLATARRLARSLVTFWMSTSRLPGGDAWFERLLGGPLTPDQDVALSLYEHGYLIFWTGDYERSGRRFTEARVMAAELNDVSIEALALAGLARVALTSEAAQAVRLLREALVITEGLPDDSDGRGSALHVLGPALQMAGDFEGAREVIERRIALARTTGDNFVVWAETANLAMVERQLGNLDRAEKLSLQAIATDIVATRELFLAWTLNGLAAVIAAQGRAERAAVLLGAADALMERAGGGWPPDELEQHDQTRALLTRDLPPDQMERATARGQALLPDAVVNYALHHDGTQEPERHRRAVLLSSLGVSPGLLVHEPVGSSGGCGGLRTNRSGLLGRRWRARRRSSRRLRRSRMDVGRSVRAQPGMAVLIPESPPDQSAPNPGVPCLALQVIQRHSVTFHDRDAHSGGVGLAPPRVVLAAGLPGPAWPPRGSWPAVPTPRPKRP